MANASIGDAASANASWGSASAWGFQHCVAAGAAEDAPAERAEESEATALCVVCPKEGMAHQLAVDQRAGRAR